MRILDYYKYSRNGTFLSVHFSKCTLTVMLILLYIFGFSKTQFQCHAFFRASFPTLLQIQFYFYCNAEIFNLIVCQNLRRRSLCQKKSECNCDVFSYHVAQCCFVCGPKKQFSKLGKDCKDLYRNTYVGMQVFFIALLKWR